MVEKSVVYFQGIDPTLVIMATWYTYGYDTKALVMAVM